MKLCFLIPYYNHPQKIARLIEILEAYHYPILVVDDGSDQYSKDILQGIKSEYLFIHTKANNGGKGSAIKAGFAVAKEMGFTHCFQIDADMQHDLSKIPLFLREAQKNPNALICANPDYGEDAPKARLYGRKITNFWVKINTLGQGLQDVMCGMRIYPIFLMQTVIKNTQSNRMDFDIEILLYACRELLEFIWIDVAVSYDQSGVSHFRILKDNLMISKIHAKHFFAIPLYFLHRQKIKKKKQKWWKHQEKAGMFWLKITLMSALYLPSRLLHILIGVISIFYFVFSAQERKNLAKFHQVLRAYFPNEESLKAITPYQHFYAFGESICDKFAVWKKRIKYQDLLFANEEEKDKCFDLPRGRIILVSHFGNIEIARAMERNKGRESKMNILVYSHHAKRFNEMINQISGVEFGIFEVDSLGVKEMLELKECIECGKNIGIMGDRISLHSNQSKNIEVEFLGEKCLFPSSAFLLAGILECPISMLWCEKKMGKYLVTLEHLTDEVKLGRNKEESIRPFLEKYISSLENRIKDNPTQWFNFFDIWEQGR